MQNTKFYLLILIFFIFSNLLQRRLGIFTDVIITPPRYVNVFYEEQSPLAISPNIELTSSSSQSANTSDNQVQISNATITLQSTLKNITQNDCYCNSNIYGTCGVDSATITDILDNSTIEGSIQKESGYYSFNGKGRLKYQQSLRLYNLPNNLILSICFRIQSNTRAWLITTVASDDNLLVYGLYLYADLNRILFRYRSSQNSYYSFTFNNVLLAHDDWHNLVLDISYPTVTLNVHGETTYTKSYTLTQYMINKESIIYSGCQSGSNFDQCLYGDIAKVMMRTGVLDLAKVSFPLDINSNKRPDAQGIINFDGTASSAMLVDRQVTPYRFTNYMTLSLKIKQELGNDGAIISRNSAPGDQIDYTLLSLGSQDIIEFWYRSTQGFNFNQKSILKYNLTEKNYAIDDGKWHNLTLHIQYPNSTLYIDTIVIQQQMQLPVLTNSQNENYNLLFGQYSSEVSNFYPFKGSLSQIIIRPEYITLNQILCLQAGCLGCKCAGQCTFKCQHQFICKANIYRYRSCGMLKQGLDIGQAIQQTAENLQQDVDNSIIFNGTEAYIVSNASQPLILDNQLTISTWLWQPMINNTNHRYILTKSTNDQIIFGLSLVSNDTVILSFRQQNVSFSLQQRIDNERWHQLTISISEGSATLYIDHDLIDSQSILDNITDDGNGVLVAGALWNSPNAMVGYYTGRLKALAFGNKASTGVAIQCLKTCGQQLLVIDPPINTNNTIMASYDQQMAKLTLQGDNILQNYADIIRRIYYSNSYESPNPISAMTAEILLYPDELTPFNLTSSTTFTIKPVNNLAPIIDLSGPDINSYDYTTNFIETQPPVPVASSVARIFTRNRLFTTMTTLIVQLINFPDGNHDQLLFQSRPNISIAASDLTVDISNDFHNINISGPSTLIDYQNHLLQIYYNNTRDEPTCRSRQIDFYATINDQRSYITSAKVYVYGYNDNKPVFNQTNYLASMVENSPPGIFVVQVGATDIDTCRGNTISYAIVQGNEKGKFTIDAVTGLVTTTQSFDYEQQSSYNLNISAINYDEQKVLQGFTTLSISILNINDNGFVIRLNGIQDPSNSPFNITGYNASLDYLVIFNDSKPAQGVAVVGSQLEITDGDSINPYITSMDIILTNIDNFDNEFLFLNSSLLEQFGIQIQLINNRLDRQKSILLRGNASHVAYPQILRTVMYYSNATQLSGDDRTIEFFASDGQFQSPISQTYIRIIHNDKFRPQMILTQNNFVFTENSKPLAIASTLRITDRDYPYYNLTSASAFLVNPAASCLTNSMLQLSCRNSTNIKSCNESCGQYLQVDSQIASELSLNYSYVDNMLSLSGNKSPSTYEAILRTLTYTSIAIEPSGIDRQVQIIVQDEVFTSLPISINIKIRLINDNSPIVRLNGFQSQSSVNISGFRSDRDYLTYYHDVYNGTAIVNPSIIGLIGTNATISDLDSQYQVRNYIVNTTIKLMEIENIGKERLITSNSIPSGFTLSYPPNTNYNQFHISVNGNGSHSEYLQIFQLFRYQAIAANPLAGSQRTISFTVNDGRQESLPSFTYIRLIHYDKLRPTITLTKARWTYTQNDQPLPIAEGIIIADLDQPEFLLEEAVVELVHPLSHCSHPLAIEYGCRKQFDNQIGRHCDGLSVNAQIGLCILSCGQYLSINSTHVKNLPSSSSSIKIINETPTRLVIKGNGTSIEYQQILSTLTFTDYSGELKTSSRKIQISLRDTVAFNTPTSITVDVVNNDNHRPYVRCNRRTFTLLPTASRALAVGQLGPMAIINPSQQLISEIAITLTNIAGLDQEDISIITPGNVNVTHSRRIVYNITGQTITYDQIIKTLTYTNDQANLQAGCRIITATLADQLGNTGIPLDIFISIIPYPTSLLAIAFNHSTDLNYFPFKFNRMYFVLQTGLHIVNTIANASIESIPIAGITIKLSGSSLTNHDYIRLDQGLIRRFGLTLSESSDTYHINITGIAIARDYQLVLQSLYYVNNATINVPPEYRYINMALQNINGSIQEAQVINIFVHPIHFYLTCPESITFIIQVTPLPFYPLRLVRFRSELGDHDILTNATVELQAYPNTGGRLIYNGNDSTGLEIMQEGSFTYYRNILSQVMYSNNWPLSSLTEQNLTFTLSKKFQTHSCTIPMKITRPYSPYVDLNGPSKIGNHFAMTANYPNASTLSIKIAASDAIIDDQPQLDINQFEIKIQITKPLTNGRLGITLCSGNITDGCQIGEFTNNSLWCQCGTTFEGASITVDSSSDGSVLYLRQNVSKPFNNDTFALLLRDYVVFMTGLMAPASNFTTAQITFSIVYNGNTSIPSTASITFLTASLNPTVCLDSIQNCNYKVEIGEKTTCVNVIPPTIQLHYNYLISNITASLQYVDPDQILAINNTDGFVIQQPSNNTLIITSNDVATSPDRFLLPLRNLQYCYLKIGNIIANQADVSNKFVDITATGSNGITSNTVQSEITVKLSCISQNIVQIENYQQLKNAGRCQEVQELDISCLGNQQSCDIDSLKPLENITVIREVLRIRGLPIVDLAGLENILQLGGIEINDNSQLISLVALAANAPNNTSVFVNDIASRAIIRYNNQLIDISILRRAKAVSGNLHLEGNENLYNISALSGIQEVGGNLYIGNLFISNLDIFQNLKAIRGSLYLFQNQNLVNVNGLRNVQSIGGIVFVMLNNLLQNLDGIANLTAIGQRVYIQLNNNLCFVGKELVDDLNFWQTIQPADAAKLNFVAYNGDCPSYRNCTNYGNPCAVSISSLCQNANQSYSCNNN
ncbi:Protocadherin beta-13 [Trichoplax sp. H2]|nr:Protocadherin beta-13 [Trichoplax sp. H2]|eukprot:RDD39186.1 Protocadherin beta-13 [Trichoplax sp. H2]